VWFGRCSSSRGLSSIPTLAELQANIDAYGTYARTSALADFAELYAWTAGPLSEAALADLINDNGWVRRMHDLVRLPDDPREDEAVEMDEEATEGGVEEEPWSAAAGSVFDLLRERADTLSDSYPFSVSDVLERRNGVGPYRDLYLALLALTLSHAYGVSCDDLDPKQVFEDTVEATLSSRGLLATNVGRHGRGRGYFDEAVIDAGTEIGLRPTPTEGTRRVYANDEKVDAVAHLSWDDDRNACWTFIGQATCAASDEWPKKLGEPGPEAWRKYLGITVLPRPFLAVPHHVEQPMFEYLVGQDGRMVLDRLRLCRRADLLATEEQMRACLDGMAAAPL
jgi:hypothetical protein